MFVHVNKSTFLVKKLDDLILLHPEQTHSLSLPQIAKQILDAAIAGVSNVIATEDEICIQCEQENDEIIDSIANLEFSKEERTSKQLRLPIYFEEHVDTQRIEEHTKMGIDAYRNAILEQSYTLSMFGFVPGFLYMRGMPKVLWVPRKQSPSTQIEQGSIAVGGEFLGLYSLETPAGWNVIGKTPIRVLNLSDTPPTLIHPGDTITLEPIDEKEFKAISALSQNIIDYNA